LAREKVEALFVTGGGSSARGRLQLAVLAARYAVPASYSGRAFVEAGGLMSYGTNYADMCRQVGLYAAGLLKGAKPMDLPVTIRISTQELAAHSEQAPGRARHVGRSHATVDLGVEEPTIRTMEALY
jgi:ABC-type uncharacterized transport system substrate-binding protein